MNPSPISDQKIRAVENSSLQLRRIYRVIRETLRAACGHVTAAPRMQTKRLLARHAWIDSLHADGLRQRVLELRYPRVDVDDGMPTAWLEFLSLLPRTENEAEFLSGVYRVVKPAVRDALVSYLAGADEIDDAPSIFLLRRLIPEIEDEIAEGEKEIGQLSPDEVRAAEAWVSYLRDTIEQLGGFALSSLENTLSQLPLRPGLSDRKEFLMPDIPARDPSYEPAVMIVPPRGPKNDVESRVWLAMDQANESWAGEAPAALVWAYPEAPWDTVRDSTRWAYDELRHAMMGERRLQAWGFKPGYDYPLVSDHFTALKEAGYGLPDALLLLHALELGGPKWKAYLVKEFENVNDPFSAMDCDYDWADEAGHIRIGLEWTRYLFPKMTKQEVIQRHATLKNFWADWMRKKHVENTHGWDPFMKRVEGRVAALAAQEGSGLSSPADINYAGTVTFDFEMPASQ